MIQAHGYIRVSHAEQAEWGLSLEAQRQECHRYWERFLKPKAVAWDKLSALAQQAAAEIYAAKPDAVRRTWSESTVRRAVDGFWRLVHTEGTEWISDPGVKERVSGLAANTTPSS